MSHYLQAIASLSQTLLPFNVFLLTNHNNGQHISSTSLVAIASVGPDDHPPTKEPTEVPVLRVKVKPFGWLSGETITILIGKKEHRFVVEKNRLCIKSKFIRTACAPGRWLEGCDMVVRLPEVYSQTLFKRYLSWIRTDTLTVKEATLTEPEPMKMDFLIKLYFLGDYLDDVRLRNVTIRALTKYGICPSIAECNMIFEETPPTSPLRKWTADAITSLADRHTFERLSVLYDLDLTVQIANMLMHQRPNAEHKRKLSERKAKEYVICFWGFAMSRKDDKARAFVVDKIASEMKAEIFEKATWPANLALQLACKLMHEEDSQRRRPQGPAGEDARLRGSNYCF